MTTTPGRAPGAGKYTSPTGGVSSTRDPSPVPSSAAHENAAALDGAGPPRAFRGAGYAQYRQSPSNADLERKKEELKIYVESMRTRELKIELKKRKLPIYGKKEVLEKRLLEAVSSNEGRIPLTIPPGFFDTSPTGGRSIAFTLSEFARHLHFLKE